MEGSRLNKFVIFAMTFLYFRNVDGMYLALALISTHISTFPSFYTPLVPRMYPPR